MHTQIIKMVFADCCMNMQICHVKCKCATHLTHVVHVSIFIHHVSKSETFLFFE